MSRLRPSVAATPFKRFSSAPVDATGDQEAALSTVAVVELVHGIHRADTAERRARREVFVEELLAAVAVYPLTTDAPGSPASWRAAAKPRNRNSIADLLIGATALSLGYSVLTVNPRHFQRVPGLAVIQL